MRTTWALGWIDHCMSIVCALGNDHVNLGSDLSSERGTYSGWAFCPRDERSRWLLVPALQRLQGQAPLWVARVQAEHATVRGVSSGSLALGQKLLGQHELCGGAVGL